MIRTGLVSITFRSLAPQEIVRLVQQSGLEGIEWGGDVHVPHGNVNAAREIGIRTRDAGLHVAAYGSYYRVGVSPQEGLVFETVLETALALAAPTIRVWAGNRGAAETDAAEYARIVRDAQCIADLAQAAGITISLEFHGGTLTDSADSAIRLLADIAHENVRLYWQPSPHENRMRLRDGLKQVLPFLSNLHVFHWMAHKDSIERRPLADGQECWQDYLSLVSADPRDRFALIEFVAGDNPAQYLADAVILRQWLAK